MVFIFILLSTLSPNSSLLHSFHLSRCEIEYNQDDKVIQVAVQIFIDDLSLALNNQGNKHLYIGSDKEDTSTDSLITNYLKTHFNLSIEESEINFSFVGKEASSDLLAIWCYLEYTNIPNIQSLTIMDNILMEIYGDQKNIVVVSINKKQKEQFLFRSGYTKETISL